MSIGVVPAVAAFRSRAILAISGAVWGGEHFEVAVLGLQSAAEIVCVVILLCSVYLGQFFEFLSQVEHGSALHGLRLFKTTDP